MKRWILLVVFLVGCTPGIPPKCTAKSGPSCAVVAAHISELGGCGFPEGRFESYCKDAESGQEEVRRRSLNLACMNAAPDCKTFEQCR